MFQLFDYQKNFLGPEIPSSKFSTEFFIAYWARFVVKANLDASEVSNLETLTESVYSVCEKAIDLRITSNSQFNFEPEQLDDNNDLESRIKFMLLLVFIIRWASKCRECSEIPLKQPMDRVVEITMADLLRESYRGKLKIERICAAGWDNVATPPVNDDFINKREILLKRVAALTKRREKLHNENEALIAQQSKLLDEVKTMREELLKLQADSI